MLFAWKQQKCTKYQNLQSNKRRWSNRRSCGAFIAAGGRLGAKLFNPVILSHDTRCFTQFFFAATYSKRHKNQWDHDHGRLIMVPFLVDERCRCHPLPCQQYSGANDTSPMAFSLTLGGVGRYLCPPPIDSQSFGPLSAQRGDWHHKCGSTPHNCGLLFCKNKCCQFWNLFTI